MKSLTKITLSPSKRALASASATIHPDGQLVVKLLARNNSPILQLRHDLVKTLRTSNEVLFLVFPGGKYAAFARAPRTRAKVIASTKIQMPGLSAVLGAAQSVTNAFSPSLNILGPGFIFGFPTGIAVAPLFGDVTGADVAAQIANLQNQIESREWQITLGKIALGVGGVGVIVGWRTANPVPALGGMALAAIAAELMLVAQKDIKQLQNQINELQHQSGGGTSSGSSSTSGTKKGSGGSSGSSGSSGGGSTTASASTSGSGVDWTKSDSTKNDDCTGQLLSDGTTDVICHDSFPDPDDSGSGGNNPRANISNVYFPDPEGNDPGSPKSRTWALLDVGQTDMQLKFGLAVSVKTRALSDIRQIIRTQQIFTA